MGKLTVRSTWDKAIAAVHPLAFDSLQAYRGAKGALVALEPVLAAIPGDLALDDPANLAAIERVIVQMESRGKVLLKCFDQPELKRQWGAANDVLNKSLLRPLIKATCGLRKSMGLPDESSDWIPTPNWELAGYIPPAKPEIYEKKMDFKPEVIRKLWTEAQAVVQPKSFRSFTAFRQAKSELVELTPIVEKYLPLLGSDETLALGVLEDMATRLLRKARSEILRLQLIEPLDALIQKMRDDQKLDSGEYVRSSPYA